MKKSIEETTKNQKRVEQSTYVLSLSLSSTQSETYSKKTRTVCSHFSFLPSFLFEILSQFRTLISRMPRAEAVSSLTIAFVAAIPPSIPIMNPVFPLSGPASKSTWTDARQTQGRRTGGQQEAMPEEGCWKRERLDHEPEMHSSWHSSNGTTDGASYPRLNGRVEGISVSRSVNTLGSEYFRQ